MLDAAFDGGLDERPGLAGDAHNLGHHLIGHPGDRGDLGSCSRLQLTAQTVQKALLKKTYLKLLFMNN